MELNGLALLALAVQAGICLWVITPRGHRYVTKPHPDITYPDWTPQEETQ